MKNKIKPIATKEGKLFWKTKDFFKRQSIINQINNLSKSKTIKNIRNNFKNITCL